MKKKIIGPVQTEFDDVVLGQMYWEFEEKQVLLFFKKTKNILSAYSIKQYEGNNWFDIEIETMTRQEWIQMRKGGESREWVWPYIVPRVMEEHGRKIIKYIFRKS